jgi:signal transduction histidine kinase
VFRSTSLRLAALYTLAFALAVIALGGATFLSTRGALTAQFDARIRAESTSMIREFNSEGLIGVIEAVKERDSTPGALIYGVRGAQGQVMAGRFASIDAPVGWSRFREPHTRDQQLRVLTVRLPGDIKLMVGDDDDKIEVLDTAILKGFLWAFIGVVILGVAGGLLLSRGVHRRLAAITGTAEAIIDGDLARRVPVQGSEDDLDRLALTLNRMLDRISSLMESLKQVSSDVAHDLRTPLTRLRQRLEAGLNAPSERVTALEGALADLDSILETFAGLLRIAQIEGGARRAGFQACNLNEIGATVVEAFAPSAEDQRQVLSFRQGGAAAVEGDQELLTQLLANLVENALRHAGPDTTIAVETGRDAEGATWLAVRDNGPGVPAADHKRVLDRFYRLERSRTTPGSGLGLAMATATARLHGAEIALRDAEPGLEVRVSFPGPSNIGIPQSR